MTTDNEILNFLTRPENIPMVFEVVHHYEPLLDHFYDLFVQLVTEDLKTRLKKSDYVGKWIIEKGNIQDCTVDYATIYIKLKEEFLTENRFKLFAALQRGPRADQCPTWYGVCWSSVVSELAPVPWEVDKVTKKLQPISSFPRRQWWLGRILMPYKIQGELFIIQLAQNKAGFIQEIIDPFWGMFTDIAEDLEAANLSLANWTPPSG